MTLPNVDTQVTYPDGALNGTAAVTHVEQLPDGRHAVLLDRTPMHPVDFVWPDQGADRGWLLAGGQEVPVLDCVVGAVEEGRQLHLGASVPVKKGTDGWAFVVAHVVDGDVAVAEGDTVQVRVDGTYRTALSAGHTGCHLASLALNQALAGAWKKDVAPDAAGYPNFDALAIDTSTILPEGSRDVYRLGKSLRRKGFVPDQLTNRLREVEEEVNTLLAAWVSAEATVTIERDGPGLTDMRRWTCALPQGTVSIPCGGTHVGSLGELDRVRVRLAAEEAAGAVVVAMDTASTRR